MKMHTGAARNRTISNGGHNENKTEKKAFKIS